ncbi:hypothetical protein KCU59_g109, partial [Aureobasidium melanogenum]
LISSTTSTVVMNDQMFAEHFSFQSGTALSARSSLDILGKLKINLSAPIIVKTNTAQHDAIVRTAREDVGSIFVYSLRRAEVHPRHGSFWALDEHDLTLFTYEFCVSCVEEEVYVHTLVGYTLLSSTPFNE